MCCKLLLSSHSTPLVNLRDKDGNSSLHLASSAGFKDVVKLLGDAEGVDVDIKDNNGRTPLHWAAATGHTAVTRVLVNAKSNPMVLDSVGKSPLFVRPLHTYPWSHAV